MILREHKRFRKQYNQLPDKVKKKVKKTLLVFANNPFDVRLKNHALTGRLQGMRAISVTGDVRIIFEQVDEYVVILLLAVGGHNKVYK